MDPMFRAIDSWQEIEMTVHLASGTSFTGRVVNLNEGESVMLDRGHDGEVEILTSAVVAVAVS